MKRELAEKRLANLLNDLDYARAWETIFAQTLAETKDNEAAAKVADDAVRFLLERAPD